MNQGGAIVDLRPYVSKLEWKVGIGTEYPVLCSLEIKKVNYIKNGGLEESDLSMWTISDPMIDRIEDNNKHTGSYSLKFYSESAVRYTVEQMLEGIPEGVYELSAFLQGGGCRKQCRV